MKNWEEYFLPELCMRLRVSVSGAGDPWPTKDESACVEYLKSRASRWYPSQARYERFDEAVRALVLATIAEVESAISARAETVEVTTQ